MRSAYATAVARAQAPERAHQMQGAGTNTTAGNAADPAAARAAGTLGVSLSDHRATPLQTLVAGAGDLIIAMDRSNEAKSVLWAGAFADRVFLIGDVYAIADEAAHDTAPRAAHTREIRDPYGLGDVAAQRAFEAVHDAVLAWLRVTTPARSISL